MLMGIKVDENVFGCVKKLDFCLFVIMKQSLLEQIGFLFISSVIHFILVMGDDWSERRKGKTIRGSWKLV